MNGARRKKAFSPNVWAVNMARGRAVQLEILASRLPECWECGSSPHVAILAGQCQVR
jgi:hypothetical protein